MKYFIGFMVGWIGMAGVFAGLHWMGFEVWEQPRLPARLELEAYRLCMQTAGETQCKMTPQDFVRYYELKNQLEKEEENGE